VEILSEKFLRLISLDVNDKVSGGVADRQAEAMQLKSNPMKTNLKNGNNSLLR
jgi:hypothetical protein